MKKVLVLTTILALGMASCKQGKGYEEKKPAEYYDYSAVKRKGCPKCGSHSIAKIDYGLTYFDDNGMLLVPDSSSDSFIIDSAMSEKYKNGELVAGGCVVKPEKYYCHHCRNSW